MYKVDVHTSLHKYLRYIMCLHWCELNILQVDEGKCTVQSQSRPSFKNDSGVLNNSLADQMSEKLKLSLPSQQSDTTGSSHAWTLLDCCFGVPLFDVEANKQICDSITSCGLWENER